MEEKQLEDFLPDKNSSYTNAQLVRVPRNLINLKTNYMPNNIKNLELSLLISELELSLSIKRAEVVKEILINYGINQSSIKILGKGEESLAVDTPDDTKQPANRRVEIKKTN